MEDIPFVSTEETQDDEKEQLRAALEKEKQEKQGLVEELKNVRAKKETQQTTPVREEVAQILAEQRKQDADVNRQKALEAFQSKNKEFHPDNDTGGLRMSVLLKELNNFKTDGAFSIDDFYTIFDKAKRIVAPSMSNDMERVNLHPETNDGIPPPKSTEPSKLTQKEQGLIKSMGWTEERYLAVKKTQPYFVNDLLSKFVI